MLWRDFLPMVVKNHYRIVVSKESEALLEGIRMAEDSVLAFLKSSGYIRFCEGASVTSTALYAAYIRFCEDNLLTPLASRTFVTECKMHSAEFGITESNNVKSATGKRVRGFVNVEFDC